MIVVMYSPSGQVTPQKSTLATRSEGVRVELPGQVRIKVLISNSEIDLDCTSH